MKNILILDLDGVLITTPNWKADTIHKDGYSAFNQDLVDNLNSLIEAFSFDIWLSSSRRTMKTISEFNKIFQNRGIKKNIVGFLPCGTSGTNRFSEVDAFLSHEPITNFLILDDDRSLNDLPVKWKQYLIQTDPLIGFNKIKLEEAIAIMNNWTS